MYMYTKNVEGVMNVPFSSLSQVPGLIEISL